MNQTEQLELDKRKHVNKERLDRRAAWVRFACACAGLRLHSDAFKTADAMLKEYDKRVEKGEI